MKKLLLVSLFCCSLLTFKAVAQSAAARLDLGTPENLLNAIRNECSKTASSFSLQLNTGDVATIALENYFDTGNEVSMNGVSQQSSNSLFILKGDRSSLYGYLVLHDTKKAFEITTVNGKVSITEIDIAQIFPDLYEDEMKAPAESMAPTRDSPIYSPMAKRQAIHIGRYNNENVNKLQSKPGSPYVFYMNITAWMDGTTPKNNHSKEDMYRVWQCTADQYSMFNLNITTDVAVYNAAKAADVLKTGNINFVNADGRSYACVGCFGTTAAGTLFRNANMSDWAYGKGLTSAHEIGHQMGMSHDGASEAMGGGYFWGFAAVQWAPIMGNYLYSGKWQHQLFTWSKGEYNTATQKQDDLQIMNVKEKVPYMVDDNTSGKKMKVSSAGVISSSDNWGQIEKNTDTDAFTFEVGSSGGKINLRIDPIEYLRQLDVAAKIVDAKGAVVKESNLQVNRSAEFKNLELTAGKYTLIIQGGAELTPQTGFSNYSTLGYYAMEGTLTGAIITSIENVSLEEKISLFPNPTADVLNISYGFNNPNTQVSLITLTGQTIYQCNELVQSIDLSGFAKGIYFLKITVNGESCIKKVLKQ